MIDRFQSFVSANKLCQPANRILLAVSGGMDSVAMAELFHQARFRFGIAHCNFGLRGAESDGEEEFVRQLAEGYRVPVHVRQFENRDFTELDGFSVQMAARELRYRWFEEIREKERYDFIATAHHLDDQAETFFINLARGTGISGLHGILPLQGRLIRPLLFTTRGEIEEFIGATGLRYRSDSSNASVKYLRNKIRHELLPVLKEINPAIIASLADTMKRIREFEAVGQTVISGVRKKIVKPGKGQTKINISGLKALEPLHIFAWELLSPFGFNAAQLSDIIRSLDGESGATFLSPTHRLIRDREELIIKRTGGQAVGRTGGQADGRTGGQAVGRTGGRVYSVEKGVKIIHEPIALKFSLKKYSSALKIPSGREFASLDYDKLEFPLTLRKWVKGDAFHPFGMNRKQKLSDFFINCKMSLPEKEETWLLCSGKRIVWVVGHRIDNRFRVTAKTRQVLQIRLSQQ